MPKKSKNPADPTKKTSTPSPPVDDPRRAVPTFDEFEREERQRARRGY